MSFSTFCWFRSRFSKDAMDQISSEIIRQLSNRALLQTKESLLIQDWFNLPANPLIMNKKATQWKEANTWGRLNKNGKPLKSHGIYNQTGQFKTANLITTWNSILLNGTLGRFKRKYSPMVRSSVGLNASLSMAGFYILTAGHWPYADAFLLWVSITVSGHTSMSLL